jgi:hypothetical protein
MVGFFLFIVAKILKADDKHGASAIDLASALIRHLPDDALDTRIPDVFLLVDLLPEETLEEFTVVSERDIDNLFNDPFGTFDASGNIALARSLVMSVSKYGDIPNGHLSDGYQFIINALKEAKETRSYSFLIELAVRLFDMSMALKFTP